MALINENDEASARDSLGGLTKVVPSILALRSVQPPNLANTILVQYGSTLGDDGGGFYIWNPTDSTADNGTTVIQPYSVSGNGRWNLLIAQNLAPGSSALAGLGQGVRATTGGDTITSADRGFLILNSGGGTVTLPTTASVGDGFIVAIMNFSSSLSTTLATAGGNGIYRPYGINIATSETLLPYESITLMADGGVWLIVGGAGRLTQANALVPVVFALTDAATINTDAARGNKFTVTIAASRTMAAPTNPSDGQTIEYIITQGGTGSNTITWDPAFHAGTTVDFPTLSTAVGKRDRITFEYTSATQQWDLLAFALGF